MNQGPITLNDLPEEVEVRVEVPKGGFVKRKHNGGIRYISPIPCPFNYGAIDAFISDDGDPLDAVILGPRLSRGTLVKVTPIEVIPFIDAGVRDEKVICGNGEITAVQRQLVLGFFRVYGVIKWFGSWRT